MDLGLEGKSALVTAASKGLGRAVAERFVDEGASVVITSRDSERLERAREEILERTDRPSSSISTVSFDLSEEAATRDGVEKAIDRLGGLDILVTNHGGPATKPFAEATLEEFDEAYTSVLRSTILVCQTALPSLRDGGGSITHLVAASALEPTPNGTFGNVMRPGIYGLSKVLANEFGEDGVRVNCVSPRGVMSDRIRSKIGQLAEREGISEEEARRLRADELPISDLGEPEEFAAAVAFVASPAASYVTGAVLPVDGGWSRRIF